MKTSSKIIAVIVSLVTMSCDKAEIPSINTIQVTEISSFSAKSGGSISNDGGSEIIDKGLVWSNNRNPTIENSLAFNSEGGGGGSFNSLITGLSPETRYYVRAYATNSEGTAYGNEVEFTTTESGALQGYVFYSSTTIPVSGVLIEVEEKTYTTSSDGFFYFEQITQGNFVLKATKEGYDVFSRNIQIGGGDNEKNIEMTSALYTHNVHGYITSSSNGEPISGAKIVVINPDNTESGLQTHSSSSGYYQIPSVPQGQRVIEVSHDLYHSYTNTIFMSNSDYEFDAQLSDFPYCPGMPYFIDSRDGTKYLTVKVGNQCWMRSNLKYLPRVDPIGPACDKYPRFYVYGYTGDNVNEAKATYNYQTYGVLYNSSSSSNCPDGWTVPTKSDWDEMAAYLNPQAGAKLKATGNLSDNTGLWKEPNNASNSSGFTALPGGAVHAWGASTTEYGLSTTARFWTRTIHNPTSFAHYIKELSYDSTILGEHITHRLSAYSAFSKRCIRED